MGNHWERKPYPLRGLSLSESHPEHAAMADGWDPKVVSAKSNLIKDWRCQKGHVFTAKVFNFCRPKQALLCHVCSGRKILKGFNDLLTLFPDIALEADGWDPADFGPWSKENKPWKCIRGHKWEVKIGSRVTFGTKCPQCSGQKVIVGETDLKTKHPDLARQAHGWDPSLVMPGSHQKMEWKCDQGHVWLAACNARAKGAGCPFCAGYFVIPGETDLATLFPEIAAQADGWDPKQIPASTQKRLPWKCDLGHRWTSIVGSRTVKKTQTASCPVCSGQRVLVGFNDLHTNHPELAAEADGWDPRQLTAGSGKKAAWICAEGHRWTAHVYSRVAGKGCPTCADYGFKQERDAWLYLLHDKNRGIMKIGVTNAPNDRVSLHLTKGFMLIDQLGPFPGENVRLWEQTILKSLKMNRAEFVNPKISGRFDGYTETWYVDSFSANSIKCLCEQLGIQSVPY